jgi:hypothetical protein
MKHIYLEPGAQWVPISKIPTLIADALHPEEPDNAPATLGTLKKRAMNQQLANEWGCNGINFGVSLTDDDLAWLNNGPWRELPPLRRAPEPRELLADFIDPPSLDMWTSAYLPAFAAHPAEGWDLEWVRRTPQTVQQVRHHAAEDQHDDELQRLSVSGVLVGKRHDSHAPVPGATGDFFRSLDLSVDDFTRYCEALGIVVLRRTREAPEEPEFLTDWYDSTLNASRWLRRKIVTAEQAAILLCEMNPDDTTVDDARRSANLETGPSHFKDLLDFFGDAHQLDPSFRTLLQWVELARSEGLKYHSWVDCYPALTVTSECPASVQSSESPARLPKAAQWRLLKPQRQDALRQALYRLLMNADRNQHPPTARDALTLWESSRPPEILKIHADGVDYVSDNSDGAKSANLRQINERIQKLVEWEQSGTGAV